MKNSKRNRAKQKRAAEMRADKPSGKSRYAKKKALRVKGIQNPNSPLKVEQ